MTSAPLSIVAALAATAYSPPTRLPYRPTLNRHRTTIPTCEFSAESWADFGQQAIGAIKQGVDVAVPVIKGTVDVAVPIVKTGVDVGVNVGVPVVKAGFSAAQKGVELAAPVVQQGVEKATPEVLKAAEAARQGVEAQLPVIGKAVDETLQGAYTGLTPEQQLQADELARVGTKVGAAAGKLANDVGLPAIQKGVETGASAVGGVVGKAYNEVAPAVDDIFRTGSINPETANKLQGDTFGALKEGTKGLAKGLRGVASLLAPDDGLPDVPAPPPRPRGINSLPRKEDIKEVSDTVATSFAQAAAPYAFGLFLLSAAFAALREIAKPLEKVVRNILAGVFLVAFGKFAIDNSETILRFLDFASDLVTR